MKTLADNVLISFLAASNCHAWLLALGLAAPTALAGQSAENQHLTQLEQVRARINAVQQRLHQTQGEHGALTAGLRSAELAIGNVTRRLRDLAGDITRHGQKLLELRGLETEQSRQLDSERQALSRQIRAAYAMGRQERLKVLLNQQDPTRLSRVLTYYDYLHKARARRISAIDTRLLLLRSTQQEIVTEESRLRGLEAAELGEREALERQRATRHELLQTLATQLQGQRSELQELRRNENQLQALLEQLRQALVDIPDANPGAETFQQRRGRMAWPVRGRLTARFSAPKAAGQRWDGVMINAPEGTEVKAVHHGRVAFADWLRGFGLLLILDHGDGWMSLYGHNQSLFREIGDWVEAGEDIAAVGSSGGQSVAGVYFGIRRRGEPVDPGKWCQKPKGRRVG